jgi:uncharacterized protein YoaH (UPF0181 family)
MTELADLIKSRTKASNDAFEPQLFNLALDEDKGSFYNLLESDSEIEIVDEIYSQLAELVEIENPSKRLTDREREAILTAHVNGVPLEEYGNWVYYSWSRTMVHILPEEEFIAVRTNRNLYKITHEQQAVLRGKKIAVLGLSVGNSIAQILAHERVCGELRLADFDELELSNLNRISSSIHELGTEKTINTARHIVMMDPYLKVKIWREGASRENLSEMLANDPVDLVFDECDNLDIKVAVREIAQANGIPVMMDTSDAGMLDIERFDREPDRDIFHGLINHLDLSKVQGLKTSEEKVPYVLPILGIDKMSRELKTSMMEIGESISTWPQIASAVIGGAGISVDCARRLLLDEITDSGRYYFDWSVELAPQSEDKHITPVNQAEEMTADLAKSIASSVNLKTDENAVSVSPNQMASIVEAAIWAPSGGNMQPWYWYYEGRRLFLIHDQAASFSILDFEDRGSYIAFGAALENLRLKACQLGYGVKFSHPKHDKIAAVVTFHDDGMYDRPYALDTSLIKGVTLRETNRNLEGRSKIDPAILTELSRGLAGCKSHILADTALIDDLGRAVADGDRVRLLHEWGHHDFINEMRWSDAEARDTGTGVDLETVDLTEGEKAGLMVARDWPAIKALKKLGDEKGTKFMELTTKTFSSASALMLITGEDESLKTYMKAGHLLEQLWIKGNMNNLAIQPVSAALFLHYRAQNQQHIFTDSESWVLTEVFDSVKEAFNLIDEVPLFLLRLGKAGRPKRSMRKPLSQVFHHSTITNPQYQY